MPHSVTSQGSPRPATCVLHGGAAAASGVEQLPGGPILHDGATGGMGARRARAAGMSSQGKATTAGWENVFLQTQGWQISHVGVLKINPRI